MRALDDKECYSYTPAAAAANGYGAANNGRPHRKSNPASSSSSASRAKPTPSKWDDAQKWLVGGIHGGGGAASKPRHSNADDRRLLGSSSQNGRVSCSSVDGALEYSMVVTAPPTPPRLGEGEGDDDDAGEGETKKVMMETAQQPHGLALRSVVCLRDMGTEMTPIASKEPSRTATPLRASTPVGSRSSTPARRRQGHEGAGPVDLEPPPAAGNVGCAGGQDHRDGGAPVPADDDARHRVPCAANHALESRAAAWDEAERAKYTARYKREEVKIQAWENQEKRRAETEMKKMQMKADQMKARAQEKLANRLAATRRIAEEKRASAEAKLNERAARTTEKANYIRRTGHLPSSFSFFKMPSFCG